MKRFVAALAALWVVAAPSAQAAPTLFDVSFTASGFSGLGTPVDPVTGEFTVTFDPTLDVVGETSGITLASLPGLSLGSPISFGYVAAGGILAVGGLFNGPESVVPGDDDFALLVFDLLGTPEGGFFVYSTAAGDILAADTITVQVTATERAVPEPATLLLLGAGLCGLAAVRRR